MKKEEYIEKRNSLDEQMKALRTEYIETNIKYPIGTRVRVTERNGKFRDGEVTGQTIDYDNVVPVIYQIKKDGTLAKRRILVFPSSTIETL